MDGTLIDSEPLHERSLVAALRALGIDPPKDLHSRVVGVAARPVYDMFVAEHGLSIPFAEWIERKYAHYLANTHELLARPGAVEAYRALEQRGVPQVIVSNSDRIIVDTNMNALGLTRPAAKSISRADVRNPKPDPEPYLRAAYLVGVDPGDCAVIEDSVPGATAGVEAGMRTYLWAPEPTTPPAGAVLVLTPEELFYHLGLSEQD
ncbi:HAD family phosphatase [Salmonella enterica subsp. enterica serovar Virchow]|nr:HAD family phosphatase [Salmonella enterica subsp. enterica serovar Virchow]ECD4520278.1 HAD family phosphatase [Salmonella enterica subsp. enterica serovar Virchow]MIL09671.1 HAD family phosphatase [Salmonella enterica subsp. enterica serovar Enteritidis]